MRQLPEQAPPPIANGAKKNGAAHAKNGKANGKAKSNPPAADSNRRKRMIRTVQHVFPARFGDPLLWVKSDGAVTAVRRSASNQHLKSSPISLTQVKEQVPKIALRYPDIELGCECLHFAHALAELQKTHSIDEIDEVVAALSQIVKAGVSLDSQSQPIARQLFAAELPLTLAALFPQFPHDPTILASARETIDSAILELLDDEGQLPAEFIGSAALLLASWTRCAYIESELRQTFPHRDRLRLFLRQIMRLWRTNRLAFHQPDVQVDANLLEAAAAKFGRAVERELIPLVSGARAARKGDKREALVDPSSHSDAKAITILRSGWIPTATQFVVTLAGRTMHCELNAGPHHLLSGAWNWDLTVGKRKIEQQEDWTNICWETNPDVVYSEYQTKLADGFRIQRQVLLNRRDEFLYLADVVEGPDTVRGEYRFAFPLTENCYVESKEQMTEVRLVSRNRLAASVLPLSLPEWRRSAEGCLELAAASNRSATNGKSAESPVAARLGNGLVLRQNFHGQRLHAATLIDLSIDRLRKPLTWRRLTVAESLETVRSDVAVGYRVQIGSDQWLIYRSLAPSANRSVLGQNFSTEFVVARFLPNGTTKKQIEILPDSAATSHDK